MTVIQHGKTQSTVLMDVLMEVACHPVILHVIIIINMIIIIHATIIINADANTMDHVKGNVQFQHL
jgi:hypothetical protein